MTERSRFAALVYSYHEGHQQFCPLLEQYTSVMKTTLDAAIAKANGEGKPMSSIPLFNSPGLAEAMEIRLSGPDHEWVPRSDKDAAAKIFRSVKSPDGSAMDFVIP